MTPTRNPNGTWTQRVWVDSTRRRVTAATKRDVERAVADLRRDEQRRKLGLPPVEQAREAISYDELCERFLAQYQGTPQAKTTLTFNLKHSRDEFGQVRVHELLPEAIDSWLAGLTRKRDGKPLAPRSRGHALKAMRQALAVAIRWSYLDRNPALDVQMPTASASETKHPFESWEEVFGVADAIGDYYSPLVRFACATGLRPQEWQALQWCDVELDKRRVTVRRTIQDGTLAEGKAKTPGSLRRVPLQDVALDALRELPVPITQSRLVFPAKRGGLLSLHNFRTRPWPKALEAAELAYRSPYAMRDTFATLSLAARMPVESIAKWMGHVDAAGNPNPATTLKHYAKWVSAVDDADLALLDAYAAPSRSTGPIAALTAESGGET